MTVEKLKQKVKELQKNQQDAAQQQMSCLQVIQRIEGALIILNEQIEELEKVEVADAVTEAVTE